MIAPTLVVLIITRIRLRLRPVLVISANQQIALAVRFVPPDTTLKIFMRSTNHTSLSASNNVDLVSTRTPIVNAFNALLSAKNALLIQCVLLATKFPSPPLLLHASVQLSRITLIIIV